MSQPDRQQIIDTLWPRRMPADMRVWAVLDGARDARIFTAVGESNYDQCCLYAGKLPWLLARSAPYLVKLEKGDRLTEFILDEGWGNNWGVFCWTRTSFLELRRHFRGFLRVKDECGRKLIFRWYDPRVFRVYVPTCVPKELKTVFGPVESFFVERAEEPGAREYSLAAKDGSLRVREI
jgi:hypothetical protein